MKPRIIANIFPYETQQKVTVYKDNESVKNYMYSTESLVEELAALYTKEDACLLTLLGSQKYNHGIEMAILNIEPTINIIIF